MPIHEHEKTSLEFLCFTKEIGQSGSTHAFQAPIISKDHTTYYPFVREIFTHSGGFFNSRLWEYGIGRKSSSNSVTIITRTSKVQRVFQLFTLSSELRDKIFIYSLRNKTLIRMKRVSSISSL